MNKRLQKVYRALPEFGLNQLLADPKEKRKSLLHRPHFNTEEIEKLDLEIERYQNIVNENMKAGAGGGSP